jgi:hypothetical protein
MQENPKPPETAEEIEQLVRRILMAVEGILDRNQRSYALAGKLRRLPAAVILEIFRVVIRGAQRKEPLYQDGFRILSDIKRMSKHVGLTKMAEVYVLAQDKDYGEVVRLLKVAPAARSLGAEEELDEDPVLKEMTLGAKRQNARTRNRDLIDRLCNDQDPMVIQHLLHNPVVTIREVVKIAAKRPTGAQVLWVIYRDARWVNHYVVKKALVNNPYTPTPIALSLIHFLLEQDLEDVAENMLLHQLVRDQAVELIMMKRKGDKPADPQGLDDGGDRQP